MNRTEPDDDPNVINEALQTYYDIFIIMADMNYSPRDILTEKFRSALLYALEVHADQVRKNKDIPYFAHLLSVTALVMEAGGNEDEVIAALLHDTVEDQGGRKRLTEIRNKFGPQVARIVDGLTDAYRTPKPAWRERKETYLQHLESAPRSIVLVSLADKVHNARAIYRDLKREGPAIWSQFNGGKNGTLWYYNQLLEIFSAYREDYPALVLELSRLVNDIHNLARTPE